MIFDFYLIPPLTKFVNLQPRSNAVYSIMDKFIVSARKYRPQLFNTVVGQAHITTTLKNAIKNQQLAHAFLFCGPRGVGKTTCARILAKTINCQNITANGEACNTCQSCISFNRGTSLNIHELDAASNNSVDDIRNLVDQVRFQPQAGKYKVYIVDEVHMLSSSAFNAFLKTLEEPPPYAIFILATTEKHKILPTILSRCQIFDFKRITNNDTVEHLQEIVGKEQIKAEKAALQIIAQKSEGCMRDSLSILDKIVSFTNGVVTYANTLEHLNILDHDYYFKLLDTQLQQDMGGGMLLFDEINRKGFEGDMFLNGYAEFIRNLLVCKNAKAARLLDVVEGLEERYTKGAANVQAGYLVGALNILNEAEINYKMARNKRLHVELALIKLCFLQQAIDLTYDNQAGSIVKKKRVNGPIAYKITPIPSIKIVDNAPAPIKPAAANTDSKAPLFIEPSAVPQTIQPTATAEIAGQSTFTHNLAATAAVKTTAAPTTTGPKKSLLQSFRDKNALEVKEDEKTAITITLESLTEKWASYTEKLKLAQKNSVVTVFNIAQIQVVNDSHFMITVSTSLQQKFIEQEKIDLLDYLKTEYCNKHIGFSFSIEVLADDGSITEVPLTNREKFQRMVQDNPLIKELKDRLKLEMDF